MDSPRCTETCPSCGLLSTVEDTTVDGVLYCARCDCVWTAGTEPPDEPRERRDLA